MLNDPLLSDDDQLFVQSLHAFASRRLRPHYQTHDREQRIQPEVLRALADQGILGLRAPEHLGGQGANAVTVGLAAEQLGYADFSLGYLLNNCSLITDVLVRNCTPEQQERWVPPIARGEVIPAICLTEPGFGSDAAGIEFRANPDGDGWRLSGEKTSVTFGMQAPTAIVFARTSGPGARGISAFYVDLDDPAVSRSEFIDLGGKAIGRASLHFDHLHVPGTSLIGTPGTGFTQVMQGFEFARAIIALVCIGAAMASVDEALEHAKLRTTFGKPLGTYQGVSFPLVEHVTHLTAARLLALRALALKDRGMPHAMESNMVKAWAPRLAVEAAHDALLTFGHSAYSDEYPLGQRIRDIIGLEIGDGTAQITKLVVARELLGREAAP